MKQTDISRSPDGPQSDDDDGMFPEWRDQPRKRAFLVAYAQCGTKHGACRACGVPYYTVIEWQRKGGPFIEAEEQAFEQFGDALVAAAYTRAVEGWEVPVTGRDGIVGYERKYSDSLLEKMLGAYKPRQYGTATQRLGEGMSKEEMTEALTPALAAAILRVREETQRQLPATTDNTHTTQEENDKESRT